MAKTFVPRQWLHGKSSGNRGLSEWNKLSFAVMRIYPGIEGEDEEWKQLMHFLVAHKLDSELENLKPINLKFALVAISSLFPSSLKLLHAQILPPVIT